MNFVLTYYGRAWLTNNPGQIPVLSEYRIGKSYNYVPSPSDTDLHGPTLHVGTPSPGVLKPSGEFQFGIFLDRSVGDFNWGEVGLFHNGSLFALGSLSTLNTKRKATGTEDGNFVSVLAVFNPNGAYGVLEIANSSNELNIQERGSIDLLPPAQVAYPNTFIVPNPHSPERGLLAVSAGSIWNVSGYDQLGYDGELASATASSVTLAADPDLPLNGTQWVIQFVSGAAAGLIRTGTFNAATRQIVLSSPLQWNPAAGDRVLISVFTVPSVLPDLPPILDELDPGLTGNDLNQLMDLGTFFSPLLKRSGVDPMEGDLLMGGNSVRDVAAPTLQTDAATKGYVDSSVVSATAGLVDINAVNAAIESAIEDFPTTAEVATQINTIVHDTLALELAEYAKATYVDTSISDAVAPLATIAYVDAQINSISGDWATVTYVNDQIALAIDDKVTTTDLSDAVTGLASISYVDNQDALSVLRDGSRSLTGNLDMGEHRIIELGEPTGSNHATTKNYVDTGLASKLPLDGSTPMIGDLAMGGNKVTGMGDPSVATDAASKGYVDSVVTNLSGGAMLLDGSQPMAADMDLGLHQVKNLADPTDPTDAANKSYVDSEISASEATLLPLDGSRAMTGDLDAGGNNVIGLPTHPIPATDLSAAANVETVQNYVAAGVSGLQAMVLMRDGSNSATGDLDLGGNSIVGLADPTVAQGAATKSYVDSAIVALDAAGMLRADGSVPLSGNLDADGNYLTGLPVTLQLDGDSNPVPSQATSLAVVDSRITGALADYVRADGTVPFTGSVGMGGFRIQDLGDPVNSQDAVTKGFLEARMEDTLLADGSRALSGTLDADGNRITGLPDTSTDESDAVSYAALTSSLSAAVTGLVKADGTVAMTGALDAGTNKVVNLGAPTADTDAATKKYVDDAVVGMDSSAFFLRDGSRPLTGTMDFGGNNAIGLPSYNPNVAAHTWDAGWPVGFPNDWPVLETQVASMGHVTLVWNDLKQQLAGYLTGALEIEGSPNLGGNTISNVGQPVADQDAATKRYVDEAIATGGGTYVPLDGSVPMSGNLSLGGNRVTNLAAPSVDSDAANRGYVNSQFNAALKRDGTNSMQAPLNFGVYRGINLADPINPTDAANKAYVDSAVSVSFSSVVLRNGTQAMTGNLNLGGNRIVGVAAPTSSTDAANRDYVDALSAIVVLRDGSQAMQNDLSLGGHRITTLAEPVGPQDAATKAYVDNVVGGEGYLRKDGSVAFEANMNAGGFSIENLADPVNLQDAATKGYADSLMTGVFNDFLARDGSNSLTGDLNADGNKIIGVGTPTASTDAATKGYVDSAVADLVSTTDLSEAIAGLASESYVDSTVSAAVTGLATEAFVNNTVADSIVGLASEAYVDAQVAGLASESYVDSTVSAATAGLATEAFATQAAADSIVGLASEAYVDAQVAGLASESYVDSAVADLASTTYVDSAVAGLASTTYVDSAVSTAVTGLATETFVNNAVAGLASTDYVDNAINGIPLAELARLDGSLPFTGDLDLGTHAITNLADPQSPQGAATKAYVDSQITVLGGSFLKLDGTTAMSGALNAGGHQVSNVAAPTGSLDAANKGYVDSALLGKLDAYSPVLKGDIVLEGPTTNKLYSGSAGVVDCSLGNVYSMDVAANTTVSFANVPTEAYVLTLVITHSGGAITFPSSVTWSNDTPPELETDKVHVITMITVDGGVRWRATLSANHSI